MAPSGPAGGFPEEPGTEPTQYANYGGTTNEAYSEYGSPAYPEPTGYGSYPGTPASPPRTPWYQRPAALVGLGVLTAALLALLIYAIVRFTGADNSTPAVTTTTSAPATTTAPTTTPSAAPPPVTTTQPTTEAPVTTTATPTTTAPVTTTSESPSVTTTTTISTSVTTVTETTTRPIWTLPTLKPPTLLQPPGQ